jgi:hypothetical protein
MKRIVLALAWILTALPLARAVAADIPAIADTNTDTAAPNTNFGSNGIVALSTARTVLLRFDQAKIEQAVGAHALLKIKVLVAKNASNAVALQMVNGPWNEKTVTAATLPPLLPVLDQQTITGADVGKTVTFDLSLIFNIWKTQPGRNFGIALVAASPAPNLSLGSREGGNPAIITTSGPPADNDVTLTPAGGDYPGLAEAIDNMSNGDRWCNSQSTADPCVIHMAAGIYPLTSATQIGAPLRIIGASRGETIILSKPNGVGGTPLSSFSQLELRDLTLVTDGMCVQGGTVILIRVVARCSQIFEVEDGRFEATDSDLTAIANGAMEAIALDGSSGHSRLTNTHVTAISRQNYVTMITETDSPGTVQLTFTDSTLSAWGQTGAGLYNSVDEWNTGTTLVRTSATASSASGGVGGLNGQGSGMTIIDSHLGIFGGFGLAFEGYGLVIDNSTIDGGTQAVDIAPHPYGGPDGFGDATILRSQLHAANEALDVVQSNVSIENSVLEATVAAALSELSSLNAKTSQLSGTLALGEGARASCDHVFDKNLQLRPASCSSPEGETQP